MGVLEFWVVSFMFSLRGHTISYPSGCYDHGAFELCLPSSGNHYQIYLLRTCIRSRSQSVTWSWGEDRRLLTLCALVIVWGVCLLPTVDVGLEV